MTLPYMTPGLPGCGGQLKALPAHFVVEEVPLYEASGAGPHLYVCLAREGWTTRKMVEALAHLFGLRVGDVGYAGLKDRQAHAIQVFSLPGLQPEAARRIEDRLPFQVLWARQHQNKLKVGHLAGNRFQITVTNLSVPLETALAQAREVADFLAQGGVPNFFGEQRFGFDGGNVPRGRAALLGQGPRDRWLRKLLISAYQSHLFNRYLSHRVELGLFRRLVAGDVAKKTTTGGMFEVQDAAAEQPRYERGEIHFTGPLFGGKMWAATGEAGEMEAQVLIEAGLTLQDLRQARVRGSRRPGRIWLPEIEISGDEVGLHLAFFLPKGSYATVVLREFTKAESLIMEPDELELQG